MSTQDATVQVRVSADVGRHLDALGKLEHRSRNNLADHLLRKVLTEINLRESLKIEQEGGV